ncbi:hypothetical protein VTO42DRAFT_4087 [Malbranchea cinnamomea]
MLDHNPRIGFGHRRRILHAGKERRVTPLHKASGQNKLVSFMRESRERVLFSWLATAAKVNRDCTASSLARCAYGPNLNAQDDSRYVAAST